MKIKEIDTKILEYLKKRNLLKRYRRIKQLLEQDNFQQVDFKKRRPFSEEGYYFRVTQKYRALGIFVGDVFVVTKISKHQEK